MSLVVVVEWARVREGCVIVSEERDKTAIYITEVENGSRKTMLAKCAQEESSRPSKNLDPSCAWVDRFV